MITRSDDADQWKANNIGIGELLYSTGSIGGRLIWEELLYSLILRPTTEFNHFSKFTAQSNRSTMILLLTFYILKYTILYRF